MLTIVHTTASGTLLDGSSKGDGAWDILRAKGWKFGRSVGIYVPHSRDRAPKRYLIDSSADALRAAGFEVVVDIAETTPRAMDESEADRAERSDARTERLTERAKNHAAKAGVRFDAEHAILNQIPLGQPILVDHYSAPRHRRALERAENNRRAGMEHHREAERLAAAAASSAVHMAARENPVTTANRIKKLEAEARKIDRELTPCATSARKMKPEAEGITITCPRCYHDFTIGTDLAVPEHGAAAGNYRAQLLERRPFVDEELTYWRGVLAEAEATGRINTVDWSAVKKGDAVKVRGQWHRVARVNKETVSVETAYGWADRCPKHEVSEHRSA